MNMKYRIRKTAFIKESQKIPRGHTTLLVSLAETFATASEVYISTVPWSSIEREQKKNKTNKQQQKNPKHLL